MIDNEVFMMLFVFTSVSAGMLGIAAHYWKTKYRKEEEFCSVVLEIMQLVADKKGFTVRIKRTDAGVLFNVQDDDGTDVMLHNGE